MERATGLRGRTAFAPGRALKYQTPTIEREHRYEVASVARVDLVERGLASAGAVGDTIARFVFFEAQRQNCTRFIAGGRFLRGQGG